MSKLWVGSIIATLACVIFIVVTWILDRSFLVNTGFLLLGVLLAVFITSANDYYERTRRRKDLARALHAETAHLVARCCFDGETFWCQQWGPLDPKKRFLISATGMSKFVPENPVVFPATASELALLRGDSAILLINFHYSLNAFRRGILEYGMTDDLTHEPVRRVAQRMYRTLEPGLQALEALALEFPDAERRETLIIQQYNASRAEESPTGTLRQRIQGLLESQH